VMRGRIEGLSGVVVTVIPQTKEVKQ
jgi:hypothetical protein